MDGLMESTWAGILLIVVVMGAMFTVVIGPVILRVMRSRKGAALMDAAVPGMIKKLGLEVPRHAVESDGVHKYEGEVEGYRLEFDTSLESMVKVRLQRTINCCVTTSKTGMRARKGQGVFRFGEGELDELFKTRYASEKAKAWFTGSGVGLEELKRFLAQRGKALGHFSIEGDKIAARFKYGWELESRLLVIGSRAKHERPYCRPEDLEELFTVMPRIAKELDSASPQDDPIMEDDEDYYF